MGIQLLPGERCFKRSRIDLQRRQRLALRKPSDHELGKNISSTHPHCVDSRLSHSLPSISVTLALSLR